MPPQTCCNTAVICSTETRFFFTAHPPGPTGRLCRKTHSAIGPKNPEPLTSRHTEIEVDEHRQHPDGRTANCACGCESIDQRIEMRQKLSAERWWGEPPAPTCDRIGYGCLLFTPYVRPSAKINQRITLMPRPCKMDEGGRRSTTWDRPDRRANPVGPDQSLIRSRTMDSSRRPPCLSSLLQR